MKKKRLKTLPALKRKLWKLFSEYIRRRDADQDGVVKCFTCPREMNWKESQAGHFMAQSLGLWVVFEEKNVHAQCAPCNLYKRGNPSVYALELTKRYGPSILEELQLLRKENYKINRAEYEELIEMYKQKVANLQ